MSHLRSVFAYIISGSAAALVNIGLLYVLTEYAHIYYLFSATLSFVAAFGVSFCLQKFWTFQDNDTSTVHLQLTLFFLVAIINLLSNITLLYALTEFFRVWYVAAEIVVTALLALVTFFVYRHLIFNSETVA